MNTPSRMLLPEFLTTDRLLLRPHVEADFEGFRAVIQNEDATRFVQLQEEDKAEEALKGFFHEIISTISSPSPVFGLAILEKGTHQYVGFCGLSELPDDSGTETYYVLHPDHWGKGYATEAAQKLFEYAFSVLNLAHLDTYLVDDNTASHQVAEKLGMKDMGPATHHEYEQAVRMFRVTQNDFFPDLPA